MASFYDTTIGQQIEFQRVLATAGFSDGDIAHIIKDSSLASKMYEAIQPTPVITHVLSKRPSWYVSPERQLERVKQLNEQQGWGFSESDFPSIPEFMPRSKTEVLMLAVYLPGKGRKNGLHRTFDELWQLIEAPDGYSKWRWDDLKATAKLLRQAPGYDWSPGIRWVAFDPNAYQGLSPEAALKHPKSDGARLAGTEVFMATLLFPNWAKAWNGTNTPFPNLSALQFYWEADWSRAPYLHRWDGRRQLELNADWAAHADGDYWSSPVVREC